jgi:hypothetical protein
MKRNCRYAAKRNPFDSGVEVADPIAGGIRLLGKDMAKICDNDTTRIVSDILIETMSKA